MKRPTLRRAAVWLVLPLVFAWLLREISLADLQRMLGAVQPLGLAALVALNLVALLLFSSRGWLALRALGYRVPYLAVFRYRTAGFAISYLTPGAQFGGEPLQVYALYTRHQLPMPAALAAVTLDKLFELLANFSFLAVGVTLLLQHHLFVGPPQRWLATWVAGLLALPLAYLALLWAGKQPLAGAAGRLHRLTTGWLVQRPAHPLGRKLRWFDQAAALMGEAEGQLNSLLHHRPIALLWVGLAAGLIWGLSLSEYWLALKVLGVNASPYQVVVALTAARIAFLAPTPGGLGALEAGQVLALQMLGFDPAVGIAISLWIRLRDAFLGITGIACGAGLAPAAAIPAEPSQAGD